MRNIQIKAQDNDATTAKAYSAFKWLRAAAERGETQEMTADEINAEIRDV